jgi:hypothetical protein
MEHFPMQEIFTVHMNMNGKYIRRHYITRFEQCTDSKWRLKCGVYMQPSYSEEEFDSLEEGMDFVINNQEYPFNFNTPKYSQEFLDEIDKLVDECALRLGIPKSEYS